MKTNLSLVFLFFSFFSSAQNPLVKRWDYRYGGSVDEILNSMQQTTDGGYVLAGYSSSGISGDKMQGSWGGWDYWIIKIDSVGNKQWDKNFGGTDDDFLISMQQTNDGGYILGGFSSSGIGGDKTEATKGLQDYWIIKIDSLGNKQWDKDFGGTDWDELFSLQQTSDKGYILGGWSLSGINGDKTQATWGLQDFWIIKTDSLGNKQWDKDFGGSDWDKLFSLQQTKDGYILGGWSQSAISGDKTQPTQGLIDYWIVKIDSFGNKQWDRDFGGTNDDFFNSLRQTIDGGYLLGGFSYSGIGGNKSQSSWGLTDFWIIKTDPLGNMQWDKDFGGTNHEDEFGNVSLTTDGGYLLAGTSYSNISGDKTENNFGLEQSWIVKTDSVGNKEWDKTIFTTGHEETGLAIQTRDGCYAIANYDDAGIGGYRTQPSWGAYDYWIVKFCDSSQVPISAFATTTPICPGTCTNFTNLSQNATSYQWIFAGASPGTSTDVNPQNICYNTPGSYDVTLIASNANGSDTLMLANYITVFPYPPPQGISQNGDTLFANAGAVSYQWYFNGNIIGAATNYFYVAPSSGDYNVVCTDGNGCEVEAVIFNVVASAQATVSSGSMQVFPNPVADKLVVRGQEFGESAIEISIYNTLGVLVAQSDLSHPSQGIQNPESKMNVDVHSLNPGIYWLEISCGEKVLRSKFVKQ